jgi:tetratricopeptide (TPR) repeat protein
VELEPRLKYGESWLYLGEAEIALGKHQDALESLKKHLSINNTSIEGLYQYARALNALGMKDEAKKAIADGIRYHKGNPSFRRRRDWRSYVKLKHFRP